MSKRLTDHELALARETGLPNDATPRGRLLSVIEILRCFSDENHGLSASEIARSIGVLTGKEPSENTVLADLHAIAAFKPFGMHIATPLQGKNTGFRCVQKHLTSDEAILAGDVVRASSFLDSQTKRKLCKKLYSLSSRKRFDESLETVYVDERNGYEASELLSAISVASEAILNEKQVIFRVKSHWMNGEVVKSPLIQEDPVAIIFSFGRYYLETIAAHRNTGLPMPMLRRIDQLCEFQISHKTLAFPEKAKEASTTVIKETREKIDMYGDGIARSLFIKVDGASAKYVFDRFGHSLKFAHITDAEGVTTGYAHIVVQLGPTFYRWLFGHRGGIELVNPPSITWIRQFDEFRYANSKERKKLTSDYEAALKGYRLELERALETCRKD